MSELPRSEPSTEPRGLRLPYGPVTSTHGTGEQFSRLRSQLVGTAVIAGCLIVLLAGAGFGSIAAGWLPTTNVAFGLAAGAVVVGIAAALRVFFLFRALQEMPPPAPQLAPPPPPRETYQETYREPEPWTAPPAPQPLPQVVARPQPAPEPRAQLIVPATTGFTPEGIQQWGDVFGKLSRRLQSLVNRLIRSIDKMEHELEDPDLLDMLWGIDHLATLVRRQAENIAVLGGETLERRSDDPVDVNAVLRSAVAEIQRYRQVVTIPIRDARIHGHVVAEIIHLLSELLDNATSFSPDDAPKVAFRAQYVTAGLAMQVQDRGIGMAAEDLRRINNLLDRETHLDVGELFKDGRIGLAVVKELARRHDVGVELQPNIYGGIDASIVVPHKLLDTRPAERQQLARRPAPRETTASQPVVPARPAADKPVAALSPATPQAPQRAQQPARPAPQPVAQQAQPAQPAQQPAPQPAQRPAPQPVAQAAQPVSQPVAQPVSQPVAKAVAPAQPSAQAAAQQTAQQAAPQQSAPQQTQQNGQQNAYGQEELEELPVRDRGTAYAAMRAGQPSQSMPHPVVAPQASQATQQQQQQQAPQQAAQPVGMGGAPEQPAPGTERPALPQRRGQQSHLRPELRQSPVLTRPIPGHSPNLLADLQLGRVAGQQEIAQGAKNGDNDDDQQDRADDRNTEGEKGTWPTI
jgi:histidine kinase/DNA gyrase B/HSP90-like ATPase